MLLRRAGLLRPPSTRTSGLFPHPSAALIVTRSLAAAKKTTPSKSKKQIAAEIAAETPPTPLQSAMTSLQGEMRLRKKTSDAPLRATLTALQRRFGEGIIMKMNAGGPQEAVETVSTGSLSLDDALGVNGLPLGRIVEIYGAEASGKTSLALSVVAQAQKLGGRCTFVDVEHALDLNYARAMGVDVDRLFISQPDDGEQALDVVSALVESDAMSVIVLDSVAALVTKAELEGDMGAAHMAGQARLMGQALRKITPALNKTKTLLIFINQIRTKLNITSFKSNEQVTSGGNALKFYASIRLEVKRSDFLKEKTAVVGTRHRVIVKKNKLAAPFHEAEFSMRFGKGINRAEECLKLGVARGVIRTNGPYHYWDKPGEPAASTAFGMGVEKSIAALEANPGMLQEIVEAIQADARRNKRAPIGEPVDAVEEEEGAEEEEENDSRDVPEAAAPEAPSDAAPEAADAGAAETRAPTEQQRQQ